MPVYVDKARHRYGRMIMCHMLADTPEELRAMADAIRVDRRHYQDKASSPHYDICKAKRARAVELGAIECTNRELVAVIRRLRKLKQFTK